jgi:enoyl-CoA hydratase
MNISSLFERRSLLKAAAALGGLSALFARAVVAHADGQSGDAGIEAPSDQVKMADIPRSSTTKVTVERRGQIVLIGINRPYIQNRIDPETFLGLAKAFYQYDHDPSLRAVRAWG